MKMFVSNPEFLRRVAESFSVGIPFAVEEPVTVVIVLLYQYPAMTAGWRLSWTWSSGTGSDLFRVLLASWNFKSIYRYDYRSCSLRHTERQLHSAPDLGSLHLACNNLISAGNYLRYKIRILDTLRVCCILYLDIFSDMYLHCESKKLGHFYFYCNFGKCW